MQQFHPHTPPHTPTVWVDSTFSTISDGDALTSNGSRALAVGTNSSNGQTGMVYTSTNGVTWSTVTALNTALSSFAPYQVNYVQYAARYYVSGASNAGQNFLAYSATGTSWTMIPSTLGGIWASNILAEHIAEGGGSHVITGSGVGAVSSCFIATSANGISGWVDRTANATAAFGGGQVINLLAYGNGTFVAVGNSGVVATSATGATWSANNGLNTAWGPGSITFFGDIIFDGSKFLVIGGDSNGIAKLATSANGIIWVNVSDFSTKIGAEAPTSISYKSGRYYVVVPDSGSGSPQLFTSEDAATWVSDNALPATWGAYPGPTTGWSVDTTSAGFVVMGADNNNKVLFASKTV